jgi:hypothetical protein
MSYTEFTIAELKKRFRLAIEENISLFDATPEADLPPTLADILNRYLPLALNLNTAKARSGLIIAPFLAEFKLSRRDRVSLFSGIEFNVDEALGLKGRCDYNLSGNAEQLSLTAPICVLVEAKNENIVGGIPQCLASMVAAQRFNQANEIPPRPRHGIVTTGVSWRFLRLIGASAHVDRVEYSIQLPRKIFGILNSVSLDETDVEGAKHV